MYSHTQRATMILGILAVVVILLLAQIVLLLIVAEDPLAPLITAGVIVILAVAAYLFKSLTVTVDDRALTWYFGPRFLSHTIPLDTIVSATPTRPPLYGGWGIHYTTRGWLYNVSGRDAVEIRLRSGKRFLLGTDEPDKLVSALVGTAGDGVTSRQTSPPGTS